MNFHFTPERAHERSDKKWNSGKASEADANGQRHEFPVVIGWEWPDDASVVLRERIENKK